MIAEQKKVNSLKVEDDETIVFQKCCTTRVYEKAQVDPNL